MGDRTTRRLLAAGLAAPVLCVTAFTVLGATRPGYDASRVFVSQLGIGEMGWLQAASFVITGLLVVAFAVGLRRAVGLGPGSTWGPRLVALAGTGFVIAGLFTADPALGYPPGTPAGLTMNPSPTGMVHIQGAFLVFGGLPAACVAFTRRFQAIGNRRWAAYSAVSGAGMLVVFIAANVGANGVAGLDGVAGLLQRIAIVIGLAWLAAFAASLLRLEVPRPRRVLPQTR